MTIQESDIVTIANAQAVLGKKGVPGFAPSALGSALFYGSGHPAGA
jgi:hypothetical protein